MFLGNPLLNKIRDKIKKRKGKIKAGLAYKWRREGDGSNCRQVGSEERTKPPTHRARGRRVSSAPLSMLLQ
jgi:hypothetical protein